MPLIIIQRMDIKELVLILQKHQIDDQNNLRNPFIKYPAAKPATKLLKNS